MSGMVFISEEVDWKCNGLVFDAIANAIAKKLDRHDLEINEAFEPADLFRFVALDNLDIPRFRTVLAAAKEVQREWERAGGVPGCEPSNVILNLLREILDLMCADPRAAKD